jgi:hypothetical protein
MTGMERDTIFITHATPDDNDFVRWLGTRLVGQGYSVWADLFALRGGTPFWSSIEEALRTRAKKVVFVVSRHSVDPSRNGVRNELSVADGVRRSLKDPEFIIPVRIDDTPFDQLPIQVHQLNALDFSEGWGATLVGLLETLEAAGVPRSTVDQSTAFESWRHAAGPDAVQVEAAPERVLTNLSLISSLPERVSFLEFVGDNTKIDAALKDTKIPHARHLRLIVTAADVEVLQERLPTQFQLKVHSHIPFETFLNGVARNQPGLSGSDARNMMTGLLRQHIELFLETKGLLRHETAGAPAYYFPLGLVPSEKVNYRSGTGKLTWKKIAGRSQRNNVYWHLAMKVNVSLPPPRLVRFKPYICFSEDGRKALADVRKAAALRRSFCRNWWNPQWRQLQEAFNAFLLGDQEAILIPLSGGQFLTLSPRLAELDATRRMPADLDFVEDPDTPPEATSTDDLGEFYDDEDDLGPDE